MKAVSYFKIDVRTIGRQGLLILLYPLFLLIAFRNSGMISWMSLFTLPTFVALPFNMPSEINSKKMVFTLPAKVSSIVLGRFLFSFSVFLYTVGITYSGFFLFHTVESTQKMTLYFYIVGICILALVSSIQYVIFYKYGEMNKMLASMITLLPAMATALAVSYLGEKVESLLSIYNFISAHTQLILIGILSLAAIVIIISIFLCISICKKKDI